MLVWEIFSNPVTIWWTFLVILSVVNILAWIWTRRFVSRAAPFREVFSRPLRPSAMIWFSAAYVFGCAFRSILPRADVQRICLFDSWLSSVLVGRSVATIAELCFIAQWAIALRLAARASGTKFAEIISYVILPIITIAEIHSWFAVITTNYLGNTIEESLWGLTYALIGISLALIWTRFRGSLQYAVGVASFGCFSYVTFMACVDVPMYFSRWRIDALAEKKHFGFFEGVHDLATRWIVTWNFSDWAQEIPWMTLYFSVAVLMSIALNYLPRAMQEYRR